MGNDGQTRHFYRSLWYDAPAEDWTWALPLGNGRLGAMLFGGVSEERLVLNEKSVWEGVTPPRHRSNAKELIDHMRELLFAGRYHEANEFCQEHFLQKPQRGRRYQPLGDLRLQFDGTDEVADYVRRLDIADAVGSVELRRGAVTYRREAFVSATDDVIVLRLSADTPGSLSFSATLDRPLPTECEVVGDDMIRMHGHTGGDPEAVGVNYEAWGTVIPEGGSLTSAGEGLRVEGADAVTLLVTAATDYNLADPMTSREGDPARECREILEAAARKSYATLLADAMVEHRRLFDRVELDLDVAPGPDTPIDERIRLAKEGAADPELLLFYFHYCRYIFISSSRSGSLPANLQGVWNPLIHPPFGSYYQYNVNFQENYWFAESLNLAECHEPFFDLTEALLDSGRETARVLGCRGFCPAGALTAAWLCTVPTGATTWGMWFVAGAWNLLHYMDHYRFNPDAGFLRERAWPVLRESCLFFLDWLVPDPETGELVSGPSTSPENRFLDEDGERCCITMGCACDQELIWHTFRNFLFAADELGIDDELIDQVRTAMDRLGMPKIGADGRIMEWRQELPEAEPGHRHVSHLVGLMPGDRISLRKTPDLAAAALASIDGRFAHEYHAQGWSLGWITALLARLGQGDRVLDLIESTYTQKLYPNLFVDAHGNVQVGDMMGVPAAMVELLVQSQDGDLHLLPALPAQWQSGRLKGFCARGGFVVDAEWSGGKLTSATIHSRQGGPCPVHYDGKTTTLETQAGETYALPI
jgi:alpha-L-fucosidase 2